MELAIIGCFINFLGILSFDYLWLQLIFTVGLIFSLSLVYKEAIIDDEKMLKYSEQKKCRCGKETDCCNNKKVTDKENNCCDNPNEQDNK